jgi:myb proto-oncogene protein
MPNKTEIRCFKRWTLFKLKDKSIVAEKELAKYNMVNLNNQWTQKEDEILGQQVKIHGQQNWVIIAKSLPGRLGRQCRERWHNVLNPFID